MLVVSYINFALLCVVKSSWRCLLVCILLYLPTVMSQSLLASFDFTIDATDQSGNGNDGTVVGATAAADGYYFDGGDKITVSVDISSSAHSSLTIAAYAKSDTVSASYYTLVSGDNGFWDRTIAIGNRVSFGWTAYAGTNCLTVGAEAASFGDWQFIVATYTDNAGGGEDVALYVDGALAASATS